MSTSTSGFAPIISKTDGATSYSCTTVGANCDAFSGSIGTTVLLGASEFICSLSFVAIDFYYKLSD